MRNVYDVARARASTSKLLMHSSRDRRKERTKTHAPPDVHVERLIKAAQAAKKQEKQEKMRSKMRKYEERV